MKTDRSKKSMRFWKNCILFLLFIVFVHYWLKTKSYLFQTKTIVDIGRQHSSRQQPGQDIQRRFKNIISELNKLYPAYILPEKYREWVMVKSGGSVIAIQILYASLTEYLVFTGTPMESQGHSGRHWANLTIVMLTGSVQHWNEGTVQTINFQPGDAITLKWGTACAMQWKANSWSIEYGRGFIPFSLPYTVADSLFSLCDIIGVFKLLKAFSLAYYFELKSEIAYFVSSI